MFATTKQFLDDLGVDSLDQLPAMDGAAGQVAMLEQIEFGMTYSVTSEEPVSLIPTPTDGKPSIDSPALN